MTLLVSLSVLDGGTLYPRVATTHGEYSSKQKTFMGTVFSADKNLALYAVYDPAGNNNLSLTEKIDAKDAVPIKLALYSDASYATLVWEGSLEWIAQASDYLPSSAAMTYDYSNKSLIITRGAEVIRLIDYNTAPVASSSGTVVSGTTSSDSVVIGSNVYATSLRAEDVLRTLDPVAVAGSSSYKEMFSNNQMTVLTSTWSGSLVINLAAVASNAGEILTGKQIDTSGQASIGSLLMGGNSNDQLWGKAGWDILDGGAGNDLIRAGNGRDIIIGGLGADELHGDFGWNTYKSEKDGFTDLIAIKSDQSLVNWLYGKAGNNPDGAKCDIIEGLDAIDKIKIIGCATSDLSFAGTTAKGLAGIGIYAKGALEALYTGGDLSLSQIQAMTTGDASAAAMANQIASYGWTWV
jgi:Ca2+-binding RTX toxin-like protein